MQAVFGQALGRAHSALELLRRPGVRYADLVALEGVGPGLPGSQVTEQIEIQTKYDGYIARQRDEASRLGQLDLIRLPLDIDYRQVRGLSAEVQQKLNQHRPETLGQAARISGITPAAISLLMVHVKRGLISGESVRSASRG
jgi:tRNA uridine 5-carboxymethylaminomethyl modification enzyme